jgi:glutaryl-CoA dehydrogenase
MVDERDADDAHRLRVAAMQGARFDWRDPLRIDELLSPDEVQVRDAAQRFAQERLTGTRPSTSAS